MVYIDFDLTRWFKNKLKYEARKCVFQLVSLRGFVSGGFRRLWRQRLSDFGCFDVF
jgi:hypothetical protein